jgi:hypothetical protein
MFGLIEILNDDLLKFRSKFLLRFPNSQTLPNIGDKYHKLSERFKSIFTQPFFILQILPDEENVAWIETPSAIGFICGITFGVLVCIVFLVINIYVCCTKDSSKSSKTLSVIQSTNTGSTLGSVRRSNMDLDDNISIKSEASNRPGSRQGHL